MFVEQLVVPNAGFGVLSHECGWTLLIIAHRLIDNNEKIEEPKRS
jgi:hypothetical protein